MIKTHAPIDLWTAEYQNGGIPSSTRTTPSGAVEWALAKLREGHARLKNAVDVGCGKGRNSLYLASQGMNVTAMDFTPMAIRVLNQAAKEQGLSDKIRAIVHDVTEPWPIGREDIDFVIDTFCFKHITPHDMRRAYKENLVHVLGIRGYYLISFASIGDGYYGQYRQQPLEPSFLDDDADAEEIVTDPANRIDSVLYTRAGVIRFFAPELEVFAELKITKPIERHGQMYERETYALLFRRNPKRLMG